MSTQVRTARGCRNFVHLASGLCGLGAIAGMACGQTFVGMGFVPGLDSSSARGISADGKVVVGDAGPAFGGVAFRWTLAGGMQSLGTLPAGTYSFGPGISGDGAVVTGYGDTGGQQRAYRWTSGGGLQILGALPGAVQSLGSAASADGSVLVGTSGSTNGYRAYRWTSAGGMEDLGTQAGGGTGAISLGYGVSAPTARSLWATGIHRSATPRSAGRARAECRTLVRSREGRSRMRMQ